MFLAHIGSGDHEHFLRSDVSLLSGHERKHSWNPVAGCERVQKPLFCDLTAAFSVLTEKYLTRVGAQLGGQVFGDPNETEVPFKPIGECRVFSSGDATSLLFSAL